MAGFLPSGIISNPQLTAVVICFLLHYFIVFIESKEYCDAKNPAVIKSYVKACSKEFVFCVQGIGGIPAKCPDKLVFNPKRENCDIAGSCGKEFDKDCIGKPCGLHHDPGCETYFICTGGMKIHKKCPKGTFFNTIDKECQDPDEEEVKCGNEILDFSIDPKDIQIDKTFETSDNKFCNYHGFKATANAPEADNGIVLESQKVTNYGEWNDWVECPTGMYFTGISTSKRSISDESGNFDHAGVTSLGFKCVDPLHMKRLSMQVNSTKNIGQYARNSPHRSRWSGFLECDDGAAVGYQLSQQEDQGDEDDTGTDNVRMICSCGKEKRKARQYHLNKAAFQKVGNQKGTWTEAKYCQKKQALCGLKTQMQDWVQPRGTTINLQENDMTGLNQLHMKCCNVLSPSASCFAMETTQYIQTCDNSENQKTRTCPVDTLIGVAYNTIMFKHSVSFYTSIGYKLSEFIPDLKRNIQRGNVTCCSGKCLMNYKDMDMRTIFRVGKKDTGNVKLKKSSISKVSQVIIECGIFKIYTDKFVVHNSKQPDASSSSSSESKEDDSGNAMLAI